MPNVHFSRNCPVAVHPLLRLAWRIRADGPQNRLLRRRRHFSPPIAQLTSPAASPRFSALTLVLWLSWLGGSAPAAAQAPRVAYQGRLVITHGGTYTGNFQSLNSDSACVQIETDEPVVLENCILAGAGSLVFSIYPRARITIRNCRGYGLRPSQDNRRPGFFLEAVDARSVRVERNTLEHVGGVYLYRWLGDSTARNTVTVLGNSARNIDGRFRNPDARGRAQGEPLSFLFLDDIHGLAGAEVAWNEVINDPGLSYCADNINFHNAGGRAGSPVLVHDNYIYGAFPLGDISQQDFEGSGIISDGEVPDPVLATQYVLAYNNVVVGTTNAGMNIAAGHHVTFRRNRIVSAARATPGGPCADAVPVRGAYAGLSIFLHAPGQAGFFGQHTATDNLIGYMHHDGHRRDVDIDSLNRHQAPAQLPLHGPQDTITLADEANERTLWLGQVAKAGLLIGASPCATKGANNRAWIDLVGLGTLLRASGPEPNGQFAGPHLRPSLGLGQTHSMRLSAGFNRPPMPDGALWRVYIDWNQDLDFADAGELVVAAALPYDDPGLHDYRFVVPATATPGTARLRVMLLGGALDNHGCGPGGEGESEDYTVLIGHCVPPALSSAAAWIASVDLGGIRRTSGAEPGGYFDGSCLNTAVEASTTYTLAFRRGTTLHGPSAGNLTWAAYADWNRDYDFDDPGETLFRAPDSVRGNGAAQHRRLTVPATATPGPVRLRLVLLSGPAGSCPAAGEGEVEDYTLNVTATVAAPAPPHWNAAAAGVLQLHPNPTTDFVRVNGPAVVASAQPAWVQVLDWRGTVVAAQAGLGPVDVRQLPPGLYLLRLRTGQTWSQARFVKQ